MYTEYTAIKQSNFQIETSMNHHNTTALLPAVDQLQWSEPQSQSLQCMFLVGQCGFKFCSLCSLLAFIIAMGFVASLCHTYIHPSSRLKRSCKHTHFSSCLQHLATTGLSLSVFCIFIPSSGWTPDCCSRKSHRRNLQPEQHLSVPSCSFHFNRTLKAKQLFQKRGMAKRGCQTFFSAFDLGVWGAHLCQTCSTQLPSTSQWEETISVSEGHICVKHAAHSCPAQVSERKRSRCLRGTSVSNMQHTAAQHKSVRGNSIEPILISAMLCPRNHSWAPHDFTSSCSPSLAWTKFDTPHQANLMAVPYAPPFFFISPAAFEARAASKICRHFCWITWWTSCRSIQILYKWCHCHADHAGQFPFLGWPMPSLSLWVMRHLGSPVCWILR